MGNVAMHEVLDSFAKVGKQVGMGESVGRIWGFLLLNSCPVTQKEVEAGTGYSRGLISQCLRGMEERTVVNVEKMGREKRYSINPSLATSFAELVGLQYDDRLRHMIEILSGLSDAVDDSSLRESIHSIISEYKKLSIAFLLFPKIIALINETNVSEKEVNEMAKKISIIIENGNKEDEK